MLVLNMAQSAGAARASTCWHRQAAPASPISSGACATASRLAGTAGTGLGALRRQSDEFDVYTAPGKGAPSSCACGATARARRCAGSRSPRCACRWPARPNAATPGRGATDDGVSLLGADGLGHGPGRQRKAARRRCETLGEPHASPRG
jgi:hypothetical protein